ncbi:hypothetical protein EMIHUDRAFT_235810 [Emiliania huxleyi CCMP1516]|uniref:Peptidase S1 domain-containing protein n=2 Tax=Emiliania huxleyi TaxID=2903 RepID=A0A0D3JVC4_EMIH1|nr:hypothetical protein EMIHUDRAFT_235810 [Emiliania huxleyi CCMP1516]EOD27459.1 hypothetical protein EMIHUDRAFT_235810 [Emiliania huxleyi CCMP1516]|eukprot:XP_005779888.1 hypothetical protein EMIHUDRAFT_235810 [Emiliania huxleyi CCMP1516]
MVIKAIYGGDSRKEHSAMPLEWRVVGNATAMVVDKQALVFDSNGVFRYERSLSSRLNGDCEGNPVRFNDQPTPGRCTATLIAPNMVATAGHCIAPHLCVRLDFIFGATSESMVLGSHFASSLRYSCASVEVSVSSGGQDWAVVRLDQSVPASIASPVRIAQTEVVVGMPIMGIGHPDGLPRKYTGEAQVQQVARPGTPAFRFATNLDAFVGSSGSGVFETERREMVGIIVSGQRDYDDKGCLIRYPQEQGPIAGFLALAACVAIGSTAS